MNTETRMIPFGKPIIGEEERNAVQDVLSGSVLVHGPRAQEFEARFAQFVGSGYATAVSSCTAALHLCYFYLGIKSGNEVIVPAQTHVATAHAVELCGATPVFVDSERETGNIDINQIERHITERTRAISVVHFLGMPVNMERVNQIAKRHNLFVVEDCALAVGSYFKGVHAGLHGDAGCFSFYPVKHITTAEGGILLTKHEEMKAKIRLQKAFGVDRHMGERTVPGVYDVTMLGFNYRMSEIHAAIGIEQIKRIPDFLKRRSENYHALLNGLRQIDEIDLFKSSNGAYESSYYCLSALLKEQLISKRFEIVNALKSKGIGTSIYYPRPVSLMSYYQAKYGIKEKHPIASWISNSSISLPVGPHLTIEDTNYIVEGFKQAIMEVK